MRVLIPILLFLAVSIQAQRIVRVHKGLVALQNENVGLPDEELLIRRLIDGKMVDIGLVRVILSKQGKTAAKIIQEFGSYRIQPGDFAFWISEPQQNQVPSFNSSRHWRFQFQAGPGFRIGEFTQNIPPGLHDYHDHLKTGMTISAEIGYYHTTWTGLGWIINQWWKNHQANGQIVYNNDTGLPIDQGDLENNIALFYTGPALLIRQPLPNPRLFLTALITAGYYQFQDYQKIYI